MLIVCPACTTAYRIELSTLGAAGRTVRCARCRATWFASVAELAPAALALPSQEGGLPPPPPDERSEANQAAHESGDVQDNSIEATSITIANAPPLVPAPAQENGVSPAGGPDIESVAARRERQATAKTKRRRRSWSWPGPAS